MVVRRRVGASTPRRLPADGGLTNIRDRVAALGGRLTVVSDTRGTVVTVDLPVRRQPCRPTGAGRTRAAAETAPGAETEPRGVRPWLSRSASSSPRTTTSCARAATPPGGLRARSTVLAAVGTATELLDAVARLGPEAVLTDIRMPPGHHMEGIEAAHEIRAEHPGIGVVVLSQHTDDAYAMALFADGSAGLGYLLKDRVGDLEDLVHALREVRAGGLGDRPVDRRRAGAPATRRTRRPRWPPSPPRELDVLREMARGRTNAGIEAGAAPVRVHGREARQRDLHQAGSVGAAGPPPGRRGARLSGVRGAGALLSRGEVTRPPWPPGRRAQPEPRRSGDQSIDEQHCVATRFGLGQRPTHTR